MSDAELQHHLTEAESEFAEAGMEMDRAQRSGDQAARRRWAQKAKQAHNRRRSIAEEITRRQREGRR